MTGFCLIFFVYTSINSRDKDRITRISCAKDDITPWLSRNETFFCIGSFFFRLSFLGSLRCYYFYFYACLVAMDPSFKRELSSRSLEVVLRLEKIEQKLAAYEKKLANVREVLSSGSPSISTLFSLKNEVTQVFGVVEKFQNKDIDGIQAAELTSGKEYVRQKRKEFNARASELLDAITEVSNSLISQCSAYNMNQSLQDWFNEVEEEFEPIFGEITALSIQLLPTKVSVFAFLSGSKTSFHVATVLASEVESSVRSISQTKGGSIALFPPAKYMVFEALMQRVESLLAGFLSLFPSLPEDQRGNLTPDMLPSLPLQPDADGEVRKIPVSFSLFGSGPSLSFSSFCSQWNQRNQRTLTQRTSSNTTISLCSPWSFLSLEEAGLASTTSVERSFVLDVCLPIRSLGVSSLSSSSFLSSCQDTNENKEQERDGIQVWTPTSIESRRGVFYGFVVECFLLSDSPCWTAAAQNTHNPIHHHDGDGDGDGGDEDDETQVVMSAWSRHEPFYTQSLPSYFETLPPLKGQNVILERANT